MKGNFDFCTILAYKYLKMKAIYTIIGFCALAFNVVQAQISIGVDGSQPDPSAMLELKSTEMGLLVPRLTSDQRNFIPSPATGLLIFNSSTGFSNYYNGTVWCQVQSSGANPYGGSAQAGGGVVISSDPGATPHVSAILDIQNSNRGILVPRTLPGSILSPAIGLIIYNTSTNLFNYYDGAGWKEVCSTSTGAFGAAGSQSPAGVAIKTDGSAPHPSAMLDVSSANRGLLITRMTINQKAGMLPSAGLIIYNTTSSTIEFYNGTEWKQIAITHIDPPGQATSNSLVDRIKWNWFPVTGATGYKWNNTNNYATATEMGTATSKTETGLACNTSFTCYVWAYNSCGISDPTVLASTTAACSGFSCGQTITVNHVAGYVAPVSKTVTYGTVTHIPGEANKCWITRNLGASQQAAAVNDATEASAGWYWRFGNKQGYKHDGTTVTPVWPSIISVESDDWGVADDPCTRELGDGWHVPSYSEWNNVDNSGGWANWNGPWNSGLKMHAAGKIQSVTLTGRGNEGFYWSTMRMDNWDAWFLDFLPTGSSMVQNYKTRGYPLRCVSDYICGDNVPVGHTAGAVAPVTKSVTYGTVTNIPGETSKCWITRNLGAGQQATAVNDATETSAGWYWQFNRKQGYKHDGTNRTPNTTWITNINENSDWLPANDPCSVEMGSFWRIPSYSEWNNVDIAGGWANWNGGWNSGLKLHAAGYLTSETGSLLCRGNCGDYWSSTAYETGNGWYLVTESTASYMLMGVKWFGHSVRCLRECIAPASPIQVSIASLPTEITWNWSSVPGATGYKWNTTNNYSTASGVYGSTPYLSLTESDLPCNTTFTRYFWAYNGCGHSESLIMTATTDSCSLIPCGNDIPVRHTAGNVAPVDKTVYYGTVPNIAGTENMCWITRNLGASGQAISVDDASEASAGWYWQFNRQQGYQHDGYSRVPATAWISNINENSNWVPANDPCTHELGNPWRLPTSSEWFSVHFWGGWTDWTGPWNSGLQLHAAGFLESGFGILLNRGIRGQYWSNDQFLTTTGFSFLFDATSSGDEIYTPKPYALPLRCTRELPWFSPE
jgi:hypothetical protein